jgi:hypothetical protein
MVISVKLFSCIMHPTLVALAERIYVVFMSSTAEYSIPALENIIIFRAFVTFIFI